MKIVYDHEISSLQTYGGVSRYFFELITRMINKADVSLHSGIYINKLFRDLPLKNNRGIYFPRIPKIDHLLRPRINRVFSEIQMELDSNFIFHKTLYSPRKKPKRAKATVLTLHDMIHEIFTGIVAEEDRELKQRAINNADYVICISENTKSDFLKRFPFPEDRLHVIHHGVSPFSPGTEVVKSFVKRFSPYILYVGQRKNYKNFSALVKAIGQSEKLKRLNLLCFGAGSFDRNESELFKSEGLNCNQIFHVKGNDQLLGEIYRGAELFVFPSLYEGFGLPLLEAMMNGCPVVCSGASCFPEIGGNAAEYYQSDDIESLSNAIVRVLDDQGYKQQLIALGRDRVKEFSWEKTYQKTYDLYKSI